MPSNSPWRAQVLITAIENIWNEWSLAIHKSSTNLLLDACPLPHANYIDKYGVYSTLDLEITYQQIVIKHCERTYMSYEYRGYLYHIPFDVINGVAYFQRIVNEIFEKEQLTGTLRMWLYMNRICMKMTKTCKKIKFDTEPE